MHYTRRLVLVVVATAIAALALFSAAATASRSLVNPGRAFIRDISRAVSFKGGEIEIICEATLNKSFHSSIAKASGTLAGFFREGTAGNCRNSLAILPTGVIFLPVWHIQFFSFAGVLPRITEVLFIIPNARILIFIERTFCLYEGLAGRMTSGVTGAGEYTIQRLIFQRRSIPLFFVLESGLIPCPRSIEIAGSFTLEPPITLRLV